MGFFDDHQRRTAAAARTRIIPTHGTPGAGEADPLAVLDHHLSGFGHLYAKTDGSGLGTLEGKPPEAAQAVTVDLRFQPCHDRRHRRRSRRATAR